MQSRVTTLLMINIGVFLLQLAEPYFLSNPVLVPYLGLIPDFVVTHGFVWQVFTYMFLHGNFMHIFFNMYALYLFGAPVEQIWGGRKFVLYYLFCGTGAGLSIFVINYFVTPAAAMSPTIGASGAVFGLLLAFGMLFPDEVLLLFFILPIKAKHLVFLYGGLELFFELTSGGQSSISHIGHLGGLVFGIAFFLIFERGKVRRRTQRLKKYEVPASPVEQHHSSDSAKRDILQKLERGGLNALTDDEYQYIKLLDITVNRQPKFCSKTEYEENDVACKMCHVSDTCFLEKVKRYM